MFLGRIAGAQKQFVAAQNSLVKIKVYAEGGGLRVVATYTNMASLNQYAPGLIVAKAACMLAGSKGVKQHFHGCEMGSEIRQAKSDHSLMVSSFGDFAGACGDRSVKKNAGELRSVCEGHWGLSSKCPRKTETSPKCPCPRRTCWFREGQPFNLDRGRKDFCWNYPKSFDGLDPHSISCRLRTSKNAQRSTSSPYLTVARWLPRLPNTC